MIRQQERSLVSPPLRLCGHRFALAMRSTEADVRWQLAAVVGSFGALDLFHTLVLIVLLPTWYLPRGAALLLLLLLLLLVLLLLLLLLRFLRSRFRLRLPWLWLRLLAWHRLGFRVLSLLRLRLPWLRLLLLRLRLPPLLLLLLLLLLSPRSGTCRDALC